MDFTKQMKILVDQWHMQISESIASIGFTSGNDQWAFVMPLAGIKTFSDNLTAKLKELEKIIGPIDTASAGGVHTMSPIQPEH